MVSVVSLAGSAKIRRNTSFEINVGLNVAVVAVADGYPSPAVVSAAEVRNANRIGAVVFGADYVFWFCGSLFRLHELHVGQLGNSPEVGGLDYHLDSKCGTADYTANSVEVADYCFARSGCERNHQKLYVCA